MSKSSSLEDITVISVTYNSARILPEMLLSIPDKVPVIIIDNASHDVETVKEIVKSRKVKLIQNSKNIGFGAACNLAANYASTEYILYLNPDASLGKGALEALLKGAKRYPTASAMNPHFILDNGARFIRRNSVLLKKTEKYPKKWFPESDHQVPILSGAALFIRRTIFLAVGGFDSNIFLYHEDDDLAKRLHDEFGPLMHIHDALVFHKGDASSTPSPNTQAIKGWHAGFSRVYVARKHQYEFARSRALWRAVMKFLSPKVVFSEPKRIYHFAYLKGALSACFRV